MIEVVTDVAAGSGKTKGIAAALGNFDGVHPGHAAIIGAARQYGQTHGKPTGVIVFEPHPRELFRPSDPPFRLTSLEAKARVLSGLDIDALVALPFDKVLATMEAEAFVKEILVDTLQVSHISVGADFCFGKNRKGDSHLLTKMAKELGFDCHIMHLVPNEAGAGGKAYSSTQVRASIRDGNMRDAALSLGRPWCVNGYVEHGQQRGRTIGFPTINVPLGDYLNPAHGVYAVYVEVMDGPKAGLYDGVANFGRRPTFDEQGVLLEAFLFDFEGDVYGREVYVYFVDFLRAERKFDGLDALKAQIEQDRQAAVHVLSQLKEKPVLSR